MRKHTIFPILAILFAFLFITGCSPEQPAISLTKSASPTTFTQVGDVITYTYSITNPGDESLDNISLTDGTTPIACPEDSLFPLIGQITCTSTYTITAADMIAGQVNTTAAASGWTGGNCCGSQGIKVTATSSALVTLALPLDQSTGLILVKTADAQTFGEVGDVINYTYTLTNTGEAALTEAFVVTDDRIPVACPELPQGGLAPDAQLICRGTYAVTAEDLLSGSITNSASAVSGEAQSNMDTLQIGINAQPNLVLEKNVKPASYMYEGETITYTLTITNYGNVPLTGPLTISDPMFTDWTCTVDPVVVLLPGEALTCTTSMTTSSASAGATFKNTATVSLKYGETTVTSNEASVTVYAVPTPGVACSQFTDALTCFNNGCQPSSDDPFVCYPRP